MPTSLEFLIFISFFISIVTSFKTINVIPNITNYITLIRWYLREAYQSNKRMELVHMIGITDIMSVAHMSKGNRH